MNHSVGANLFEESLHTFEVEQVNLMELRGAASEFSDTRGTPRKSSRGYP